MKVTNYNELMRKALWLAKEQGVSQQAELNTVIYEVFSADKAKRESAGK